MTKGLVAGLAGLGAATIAVLQTSRSGDPPDPVAPPMIAPADAGALEATGSRDGGTAAQASTSADTGGVPVYRSDAGTLYVGGPPGRLGAAGDAGHSDAGSGDTGSADGGGGGSANADELRRLRERVASLEQELARTHATAQQQQQQVEQLNDLNKQVTTLREQLAEEQQRRHQEEAAAQQARQQETQAVTALSAAQQQLAAGDSRVLETLESASPSLPAPAQRAVASARSAVQSGDLAAARYWLSVAIAQTQQGQVTR